MTKWQLFKHTFCRRASGCAFYFIFLKTKAEALLFTLEIWLFLPLLCLDLPTVAWSSTLQLRATPPLLLLLALVIDTRKTNSFLARFWPWLSKSYLWSKKRKLSSRKEIWEQEGKWVGDSRGWLHVSFSSRMGGLGAYNSICRIRIQDTEQGLSWC